MQGVRSDTITTARLTTHYLESGADSGDPVIFFHGNLATGRFYEHTLAAAPDEFRCIAPDMRGFGDSEKKPIDAIRGLRDWSDDTCALLDALHIDPPFHLVGWSTGGGAVMQYLIDHPISVASLTLIDPVSPYGFGGTKDLDGSPSFPDYAGAGGATGAPDFVARLSEGDRTDEDDMSPRSVMNAYYWSPDHREPPDREEMLVDEILKSLVGDGGYPGDFTASDNWPGFAPGTTGILNALSGKYLDTSGIVDVEPKPPILWVRGSADLVVADGSGWEMGTLGSLGVVPGWPGEDVYPPQPMVAQTRAVLDRYADAGGRYREEVFEGSGHGPHIDQAERFDELLLGFLSGR
jgi:pimeloyl-ACP methyl ester carboxylesterase